MSSIRHQPSNASTSPMNPGGSERAAWAPIQGTWKPLHGKFAEGCSIEWHEFLVDKELDWGSSFHPGSLEICLNFAGKAFLKHGKQECALGPNQIALYTVGEKGDGNALREGTPLRAGRRAGCMHRFLTVELTPGFLLDHFGVDLEHLKKPIQSFVNQEPKAAPFIEVKPLPSSLLAARVQFLEPPVSEAARRAWYLGRVLEILSYTAFSEEEPREFFCQKFQRTNRERIDRVRYLIERDLENPPTLGMLAKEVGCSTYYLSRIFVQTAGVSIPQFLRMKRIERAAEIIAKGKMNVTEAAMAVGYSSLSAFTKAFVEQMGCCPGLYPNVRVKPAPVL